MQTQTIEFQANIKNGVVHIPKKYNYLQQQKQANFIVSYEYSNQQNKVSIFDKFQIDFNDFKFDRNDANHR